MVPAGDFDPPAFVPYPTHVNNGAHAPAVMSQEEDEEELVQRRYILKPRSNPVNTAVSPVHSQPPGLVEAGDYYDILDDKDEEAEPPRVHPSVTSATISPNLKGLRSRVAIVKSDIDPSIIPRIKAERPQRNYAHGYSAANHALQLCQLQETMHANFPNKGFSGAIIDDETGKLLEFHRQ